MKPRSLSQPVKPKRKGRSGSYVKSKCQECGKVFTRWRELGRFCSDSCRLTAYRKRLREAREYYRKAKASLALPLGEGKRVLAEARKLLKRGLCAI